MIDEEQSAVTEGVTPLELVPFAPFPDPTPNLCLVCSEPIDRNRRTCSNAHRQALHRDRDEVCGLVRAVLRSLVGEAPARPPRFWPLIKSRIQHEVARLSAEQKAARLPGAPRPHVVEHGAEVLVLSAAAPGEALALLLEEHSSLLQPGSPVRIRWRSRRGDGACDRLAVYRLQDGAWVQRSA